MAIDMRAVIAGLASGANTLGANLNKRKEREEVEADRVKAEQRAEDRAMRMLLAKPHEDPTQIVTGEDAEGPGIFLVNKKTGTKKRIPDEAMAALTGAAPTTPPPSLLRKPGDAMPSAAPATPAAPPVAPTASAGDEMETHGFTGDPYMTPPPTARRLGGTLRPLPPKVTPPTQPHRTPRSIMVDGKPVEAMVDPAGKFYNQDGTPITGTVAPYTPEKPLALITGVGAGGKQIRVVDKPGVEVPNPTSSGAATFKKAIAENRARMKDIDAALVEYDKHPEATGGLLRDVADVVPITATAITKYDQNKHPELVPAQAAIANIGSLVIHDRSGAAVTISEFPRLAPFIPAKGDKPEVVRAKLKSLRQQIERLNAEMEGPETASGSADPEFDALLNKYRKPPT